MIRLSISEALSDPQLLGAALGDLESWKAWIAILKSAFAEPLDDEELAIFKQVSGGREPPKQRVKELWVVCGRRGGKSRMAAALSVHAALLMVHTLAAGERGRALVLATSKDQAGHVREYARAFISESPILRQSILEDTRETIKLKGGTEILAHASSFRSVRGGTLISAVFDETAFWREEGAAHPDKEVYRAITPALITTNGMLISISSPYRKSGLMYEKYKAHYGKDNDSILVVQCPTRTLNPTIPQSVVDQAMAEDPDAARSEFLAQFRDDISDFISRDAILACVPEIRERPPEFAHKYIGAVDPSGGRNDSMTLAIAHYEGSTAILDLIREVKPPFSPEGVVDEFCQTLARYRCASVLGDKFGAEWVQSQFRNRGVNYRETDKSKSDIYVGILPAINSKAVSLLNNETLINQLCALERRATRGARRQDTIDHGPGQHDDVANAATIALLYASRTSRYTRNKKPGKILLGYMQSKGHLKKRQQQW